jgi:hypothetical protein
MDLSDFRTEKAKLEEETTIHFGEDSSMTILPFKNRGFLDYFSRLRKPYEQLEADGNMPEDVGRETLARSMAEKMVTGWKHLRQAKSVFEGDFPALAKKTKDINKLKDDDKVEIPYSKENCFIILRHESYDDFRGWILKQSRNRANWLDLDMEGD